MATDPYSTLAKPVDPDGRPVSWLWVTGAPGFAYEGTYVAVDAAWIDERIEAWRRMTSRGYRVPALAEHRRDGTRIGDVLALARLDGPCDPSPTGPSLVAAVAWVDPTTPKQIADGAIRYASPGLRTLTDDAGETHTLALVDLSIASAPHQKTGATHVIAAAEGGTPMGPETPPAGGAPSDADRLAAIEKSQADLRAAIAALTEQLAALLAKKDEEGEKDDASAATGATTDPAAVAMAEKMQALEARLAAESTARKRAEFLASFPSGAEVSLTPELADACFEMAEAAPKAFAALALAARRPSTASDRSTAPAAPPRRSEVTWGVAMAEGAGRASVPADGFSLSEASDEDVDKEARRRFPDDRKKQDACFFALMSERAAARAGGAR